MRQNVTPVVVHFDDVEFVAVSVRRRPINGVFHPLFSRLRPFRHGHIDVQPYRVRQRRPYVVRVDTVRFDLRRSRSRRGGLRVSRRSHDVRLFGRSHRHLAFRRHVDVRHKAHRIIISSRNGSRRSDYVQTYPLRAVQKIAAELRRRHVGRARAAPEQPVRTVQFKLSGNARRSLPSKLSVNIIHAVLFVRYERASRQRNDPLRSVRKDDLYRVIVRRRHRYAVRTFHQIVYKVRSGGVIVDRDRFHRLRRNFHLDRHFHNIVRVVFVPVIRHRVPRFPSPGERLFFKFPVEVEVFQIVPVIPLSVEPTLHLNVLPRRFVVYRIHGV